MNPQAREILPFKELSTLPDVFYHIMVRLFATALLRLRLCTIVDDDGLFLLLKTMMG